MPSFTIDVSESIGEMVGEVDYLLEAMGEDKTNDSSADYENWLTVFGHGDLGVSFRQEMVNGLGLDSSDPLNEGKRCGLFFHNINARS
jgi:hypothetical protein